MGRYLLVNRCRGGAEARVLSTRIAEDARGAGYRLLELNAHAWLATTGHHPPSVRKIGGWTLIGDVFDRRSPDLPATASGDPWDYERKMMARFWGRYVGVRFGTDEQLSAALRDPSGALECIFWSQDGLTLVCGSADDWLFRALRPDWRLDVDRLAGALHDPVPATGPLLLDGPTALQPGSVQTLPPTAAPDDLWRPTDFARRSLGAPPPVDQAADGLRAAVDEAVAGLGGLPGTIGAEVSGGLDSSIIASSLALDGVGRVSLWLNAYGTSIEADERAYAAALGAKLGFTPTCVPHATAPLSIDWLEALSPGFRPGLTALDRPHDLDWAQRLGKAGATGLLTGAGGDSALFQRATVEVFIDEWRRRPWRGLWSAEVHELAAANECSIWTMIAEARRRHGRPHTPPRRDHPMLARPSSPPALHPWLENWNDFGPAKAMHLAGIVDNVARHQPSELTSTIDVRHPLCAQPVIETCLALPAALLTLGGRERGLARRAFSDRLPPEIADRRSKGDMTRTYGRLILGGLDVLRPWLIEGRLAALGVIDPGAASQALTREALLWRGRYSTIMVAAAFESWVRTWERRLAPGR
ncbi:MAG: asparagine synthase C-terminal domain-containing protein [Brevundimonas sp.]